MEVQPQLVLLQKTLLNIEGLGRQLDPDLDLWKTAKPFLDRWMSEQVGVHALIKGVRQHLPKVLEQAPELPSLIHGYLVRAEQAPRQQNEMLKLEVHKLEQKYKQQRQMSIVSAVIAITAAAAISYYF